MSRTIRDGDFRLRHFSEISGDTNREQAHSYSWNAFLCRSELARDSDLPALPHLKGVSRLIVNRGIQHLGH